MDLQPALPARIARLPKRAIEVHLLDTTGLAIQARFRLGAELDWRPKGYLKTHLQISLAKREAEC